MTMVMSPSSGWRCVIVASPSPVAAIGGALRHAFPIEGRLRALDSFEPWLRRLGAAC